MSDGITGKGGVSVKWHLIPDGTTTIVRVTIEGEMYVDTATALRDSQEQIAQLISRVSNHSVEQIKLLLEQDRWVGDWARPDEPSS